MKSDNYVVVQGWMCNELELKGNELLVFALIYGFSRDGNSKFQGSRKYIADTFNISLPTVDKSLNNLVNKGYLNKEETKDFVNSNIYFVNFEVVKKLCEGSKETLHGGSKETLHNKTSKQTTSEKEKSNSKELLQNFEFGKQKSKKPNLYTKCSSLIKTFTSDKDLQNALKTFLDLRLEMAREENKQFYFGMWTHLISELKQLATNDVGALDIELAKEIVSRSTIRGWKHFYELTSNDFVKNYDVTKHKPWEEGVRSSKYTEEELEELEELNREREKKGMRTTF